MSFEQLDIEHREQDKKRKKLEKEKTQQFWLEKQILRETSGLLRELAQKIADEFGIDIMQAQKLIEGNTSHSLDTLKGHVHQGESINLLDLQNAISQAKERVAQLSKKHRESLKELLQAHELDTEHYEYRINKKIFPPAMLSRAQNPQNFSDQVLGIGLGIIDSSEAVIIMSYEVGKGVILSPYHLYLLLTGKGRYDGWKKI